MTDRPPMNPTPGYAEAGWLATAIADAKAHCAANQERIDPLRENLSARSFLTEDADK